MIPGSVALETIDRRLDALAKQPFRTRFHLRGRERALVQLRGLEAIRHHAEDVITRWVAPAVPHKDGRQTPYRGLGPGLLPPLPAYSGPANMLRA